MVTCALHLTTWTSRSEALTYSRPRVCLLSAVLSELETLCKRRAC